MSDQLEIIGLLNSLVGLNDKIKSSTEEVSRLKRELEEEGDYLDDITKEANAIRQEIDDSIVDYTGYRETKVKSYHDYNFDESRP